MASNRLQRFVAVDLSLFSVFTSAAISFERRELMNSKLHGCTEAGCYGRKPERSHSLGCFFWVPVSDEYQQLKQRIAGYMQ